MRLVSTFTPDVMLPIALARLLRDGETVFHGVASPLPMIAIFVLFYFLLIRPQSKRAKEHRAMVEALQKGDEVETAGGIVGRVTRISDTYVGVEIAQNVEVNLQRTAIAKLLPKGTIKSL